MSCLPWTVAAIATLAAVQQVIAAPVLATVLSIPVAPVVPARPVSPASPASATSTVHAMAIVLRDQTPLRAGPHEASTQQAMLWQGEVVEVRGERLDHLQVWDYRRERGGYIETGRARRLMLGAADAPELLAVIRFVRDAPGAEALGIGLTAAYLQAAPAETLRGPAGAEVFDVIGTLAERLAQRASPAANASTGVLPVAAQPVAPTSAGPTRAEAALAAHLEVAARYGVAFKSFETQGGTMRICYDGEAYRRVLAMSESTPAARARAALGLTRPDCIDPALPALELQRLDDWRADVLDRVDTTSLAAPWKGRIAMRRAGVWAGLAFQRARRGDAGAADAAGQRAMSELASVSRSDIADPDLVAWNEAAVRVGASRWAGARTAAKSTRDVRVVTQPGEPGQTCVLLVDSGKHDAASPLARRCTYGVVWVESASLDRDGRTLALAVQPLPAWRELWLFARQPGGNWVVQVLPPSTVAPELGYAEFAGWVPGGRQLLVAREARGATGWKHSFEVVRLDTLGIDRQTAEPATLGPFQRWQDPAWKRDTVSLR